MKDSNQKQTAKGDGDARDDMTCAEDLKAGLLHFLSQAEVKDTDPKETKDHEA